MPLKRIPRVISPELLGCLAAMGHGDEILIADANFPSHAQGAKHVIHCDGSTATQILAAIVELLPLDSFVSHQAAVMKRVDSEEDAPIIAEFQKILDAEYLKDGSKTPVSLERVERFAFYDRAKSVFAVCVTGESRLYGNIIVKKGVIGDDGNTVLQSANVSVSGKEAPSKRLKASTNTSDRAKADAKAKKVTSTAIETKISGTQDELPLEAASSTSSARPKRNAKVDPAATTSKAQSSTADKGKAASPEAEPAASAKNKSTDAKANEESPNKRAKTSKKAGSDSDEEREPDQDEEDGTITLFSIASFQQQSLARRKEQEEEKNKKTRRSLNSLSAQQQFELALKRSLTETSKESKE